MTATEYAKQFENFPTYHKIAIDAFKAGMENAKTPNIQKLEKDLKKRFGADKQVFITSCISQEAHELYKRAINNLKKGCS